jgi:hypothetical protein
MKKEHKNSIFVLMLIVALAFLVSSVAQMNYSGYTFNGFSMDNNNVLEVNAGTAQRYTGLYGAYLIEVDNEVKGYYTFSTGANKKTGGLSAYSKQIDLDDVLNNGNNNIKVYYSIKEDRNIEWDDYLSDFRFCGNVGSRQFYDKDYISQYSNMVKEFSLCSSVYECNNNKHQIKNGQCFYVNNGDLSSRDMSFCECIEPSYDNYNKLSINEVNKIKSTFDVYETEHVKISQNRSIFTPVSVWFSNLYNKVMGWL